MNTDPIKISLIVLASVLLTGCIKNNIPYPRIQVNFQKFEVKDEIRTASIDSTNMQLTVFLSEAADIYAVDVLNYTLTPGGEVIGDILSSPLDLSKPQQVTLKMYQEYQWTITARQDIDRYFTVESQIGSSTIDAASRRVIAYVPETTDITHIKVETIKLGLKGSEMSPDIEGTYQDFSHPVKIKVTSFGRDEDWDIYVEQTESTVSTLRADAWTRVAWVYAQAQAGRDNGIQYRLKGSPQWTNCTQSQISANGGSYHARITGLLPMTTYETRAFSDEDFGTTIEFTTGEDIQLPNMTFDDWWLNGKIWNPWPENGEQYWDTGNKGATTLGASNSTPTDDTSTGTGLAAKLETKFVGIGALGKLAAGNIFVGKYVRTVGTNGILSFGRPFIQRPTKLTGYFKYTTAPISSTSQSLSDLKGRPDTAIIWMALVDLDEPLEIRTDPNNRQLFDPEAEYVVAYGNMETAESTSEYARFEIELDYKATDRRPKYILLTASASKYGDYFTGGNGAVLYIDDLQLLYDY